MGLRRFLDDFLETKRRSLLPRGGQATVKTMKTLACLCVAVLLIADEVSAGCRRRMTVQTITHEDCLPKRLITYTCMGTCSSYTRVSADNPAQLERSCFQCRETAMTTRHTKVRCPGRGRRAFTTVRIPVAVPQGCMCEACDTHDDVIDIVGHNSNDTDTDFTTSNDF